MDAVGIYFANPTFLNLLVIPVIVSILWVIRFVARRLTARDYLLKRETPVKEKYLFAGPMFFWLCLTVAIACLILACARPQKVISVINKNSVDLVILQDGSASMYVRDVKPDRWGRAVVWTKTLVELLAWKGDRIALTTFAYTASPMIRLTTDPNVVMFFLDHLKKSPFPLSDTITWDTNMEEGVYWGVKILARDAKLNGLSKNPQAFIAISDGQVWSGRMEAMFKLVKNIGPVYVIGVGTTGGGNIPWREKINQPVYTTDDNGNPMTLNEEIEAPFVHSSIDRQSLRNIAVTTGGEYFELGTQPDAVIAAKIISAVQRRKTSDSHEKSLQDLYWYCLLGSSVFTVLGIFFFYK